LIGGHSGGRHSEPDAEGGREREVSAVPDGAALWRVTEASGRPLVTAAGIPAASWRLSGFTWAAHQPVWLSIR
jgi:hypothetical protein